MAFSLIRERFSPLEAAIFPFVPSSFNLKKRKLLEIVTLPHRCVIGPLISHTVIYYYREKGRGGGIKFPLKRVKSLANQRFRFRAKFMHGNLLDS